MFVYSGNEENSKIITDEFKSILETGAKVLALEPQELPFSFYKGIKIPGQAQFNPLRYVQNLAKAIESEACMIFENTRVTDIKEKGNAVFLKTTNGNVKANYVVHATHTPKGARLAYHTVLGPYREYGVAAKLVSTDFPDGIFWGYFGKGDKFSVRSYFRKNECFIIAVGKPHKVGQAENNEQNLQKLVSFLHEHFEMGETTHEWGGQHYRSADKLPYIGKKTKNSRIYIATGFSTDGLTYGTLAAQLISDEIAGRKNPYVEFYKASRFSPAKSAKEFVKENLNAAGEVVKDLIEVVI